MTTRAEQYDATVASRVDLSPHLVRLQLTVPGFMSTGVPDEWVGLVVPGQFQVRYYTVRAVDGDRLTLDVVRHDEGLVTEWVGRDDCVGASVVVTEPKGSCSPPDDARWLWLVGDLTALPAMARIAESRPDLDVRMWAEVPEPVPGYVDAVEEAGRLQWLAAPPGGSALADLVSTLAWPDGPGYFWMAGESAQMRAIRKHLMREVGLPSARYDVMGYWRVSAGRQPRAVDPGPIWREGKARGQSDEEIWAAYDEARGG